MAGTPKRIAGPIALTATSTTNVYNQGSALIYDIIRQIHVVNKTAGAVNFSLWLGATGANAAGSELFIAQNVAANQSFDWYGFLRMDSTDFLVGGASALTSLSITLMGEKGAV